MTALHASEFFDLERYEHRSLFAGTQYVWEAIGKLAPYLRNFSYKNALKSYPGVTFVNPEFIFIGDGVTIEPGAYIEGPCVIDEGSTVRHAAYIRGNVIVGKRSVVGHCTELKNVILLEYAHLAHFAYAGDSICGRHCNIGAGVRLANLKLSGSPVVIKNGKEQILTHMRKFGAIVGDGVQIGCNAVTNPGTILGKNCQVHPCLNFGGIAPAESTIFHPNKPEIRIQR